MDGRIYYEDFLKIMAGQIGQQQKRVSLMQATEAEVTNVLKLSNGSSSDAGQAMSEEDKENHGKEFE